MAKFCGVIGFASTTENQTTHVWETTFTERTYYGDLIRNRSRFSEANKVNGDVSLNNSISVIADAYLTNNYSNIRYVIFNNVRWIVSDVEVKYPRLILSLGGVYNGNQASIT